MNSTDAPRPPAGWSQVWRDLGFLLPGLPIAVVAFVPAIVGFFLGIGLVILAFAGLVVLVSALAVARRVAAVERRRVAAMERRPVGPVYYTPATGRGFPWLLGRLRDPQRWWDWGYCVAILPVRVLTWSLTMVWLGLSIGLAPLIVLAWAISGGGGFRGLPRVLGVVLRSLATIESSIVWAMLTNENAALRARADELSRSRQAVVDAGADTLRRVERDIHDGPQQRLVRLTMDLQSAQRRLGDDPDAAAPLVEGALKQTEEALAELRALSRGIAPPILTDRGLKAALTAAAARCPIPTTLNIHLDHDQRLPPSVENAAYFVVTESLTNAAKHSDATQCDVTVAVEPSTSWLWGDSDGDPGEHLTHDVLTLWISDDGRGGAHLGKGHGLAGLADRLSGVDGHLTIDSPPGTGTTITATIPLTP
ncbi:sensor histidine kinase [Phytoactinopolyspora halotolerans]|uniref:histidine kinase n=1 Tax=Phytoactinopolyspora halotolerans TaxID=1981512 RepID=A0A6L9SBW6_9ACTN|nr:sensor histidine kinase [Phytoactinopolyspora halotolerans]NEE02845.1 sensor histidine kinase [Phytoactinopolyspora halotolerans]